MTAIILEPDQRLRTTDIPHKKIAVGMYTWLACKLPAGDYAFHQHGNFDHDGYGGNPVEFLLESGNTETFHGPYRRYDLAILGADPIAEKLLGIPGCSIMATKLTVGKESRSMDDHAADRISRNLLEIGQLERPRAS